MFFYKKVYVMVMLCFGLSGYISTSKNGATLEAHRDSLMQIIKESIQEYCINNQCLWDEFLFKKTFIAVNIGLKNMSIFSEDKLLFGAEMARGVRVIYSGISSFIQNSPDFCKDLGISLEKYKEFVAVALNFSLEDIQAIGCDTSDIGILERRYKDFVLKFMGRVARQAGDGEKIAGDDFSKFQVVKQGNIVSPCSYSDLCSDVKACLRFECAQQGLRYSEPLIDEIIIMFDISLDGRLVKGDIEDFLEVCNSIKIYYDKLQQYICRTKLKRKLNSIFKQGTQITENEYDGYFVQVLRDINRQKLSHIENPVNKNCSHEERLASCTKTLIAKVLAIELEHKKLSPNTARGMQQTMKSNLVARVESVFSTIPGQDGIRAFSGRSKLVEFKPKWVELKPYISVMTKELLVADLITKKVEIEEETVGNPSNTAVASGVEGCYKPMVSVKRSEQVPDWARKEKDRIRALCKQKSMTLVDSLFNQVAIVVDAAYKGAQIDVTDRQSKQKRWGLLEFAYEVIHELINLYKTEEAFAAGLNQDQLYACMIQSVKSIKDEHLHYFLLLGNNMSSLVRTGNWEMIEIDSLEEPLCLDLKNNFAKMAQEVQQEKAVAVASPVKLVTKQTPKKLKQPKAENIKTVELVHDMVEPVEQPMVTTVNPLSDEIVGLPALSCMQGQEFEHQASNIDISGKESKESFDDPSWVVANKSYAKRINELQRAIFQKLSKQKKKISSADRKKLELQEVDQARLAREIDAKEQEERDKQGARDKAARAIKLQQEQEAADFQEMQCRLNVLTSDIYADGSLIACIQKEMQKQKIQDQDDFFRLQIAHSAAQQRKQQCIEEQKRMIAVRQMNEPWMLCDKNTAKNDSSGNYEYKDGWYYNNPYDHEKGQISCMFKRKIITADDIAPLMVVVPVDQHVNQEVALVRKSTRMTRGGRR